MRRFKFIGFVAIVAILLLGVTGCTSDNMENIDILVTNYPNEFVTQRLYGEHATVTSIYPDGVDISSYKINSKQKKDFSEYDLFIYNGLIEKERDLAIDLLSLNPKLLVQ